MGWAGGLSFLLLIGGGNKRNSGAADKRNESKAAAAHWNLMAVSFKETRIPMIPAAVTLLLLHWTTVEGEFSLRRDP